MTFTLVRYIVLVLSTLMSSLNIFISCVWVTIIVLLIFKIVPKNSTLLYIFELIQKLAILVANQTILTSVVQNGLHDPFHILCGFFDMTSILTFAYLFSTIMHMPAYTGRGLTLLLYMYTDATNNYLEALNLEFVGVAIFGGLYISLNSWYHPTSNTTILNFFGRALNMVSVNLILSSILLQKNSANIHTSTVLSLSFLYLLASFAGILPQLNESRDYAVWRTAQNLHALYNKYEQDEILSFLFVCVILICKCCLKKKHVAQFSTLLEISSLLLVNIVLASVSRVISNSISVYQIMVLFIYVIIINYGTQCLVLII